MNSTKEVIYQVSTLQALSMGYTHAVVSVDEFLKHGDIGLGTFENVDGEMIILDGKCYRAMEDGKVLQAEGNIGVPFAVTSFLRQKGKIEIKDIDSIDLLKERLDIKIEENFGLNSMHIVRIDGNFEQISARSESPYESQHVSLKDILQVTQKDYIFNDIKGSLVCVYFPDFMDGINAPGWHLHFLSEDKTLGGHVFDLKLKEASMVINKISGIEIQLPNTPAFDTYSLKDASQDEIKEIEQAK